MDANQIVTIIQSVGFPIVACSVMGYFVYYMYNKNMEQVNLMTKQHQEELQELQRSIDNNTVALTQVIDAVNAIKREK